MVLYLSLANVTAGMDLLGFHYIYIYTHTHTHRVGSGFVTVRFTTIHFYDPCRVEPSTPDLWCITVANQASFLYLVRF